MSMKNPIKFTQSKQKSCSCWLNRKSRSILENQSINYTYIRNKLASIQLHFDFYNIKTENKNKTLTSTKKGCFCNSKPYTYHRIYNKTILQLESNNPLKNLTSKKHQPGKNLAIELQLHR